MRPKFLGQQLAFKQVFGMNPHQVLVVYGLVEYHQDMGRWTSDPALPDATIPDTASSSKIWFFFLPIYAVRTANLPLNYMNLKHLRQDEVFILHWKNIYKSYHENIMFFREKIINCFLKIIIIMIFFLPIFRLVKKS